MLKLGILAQVLLFAWKIRSLRMTKTLQILPEEMRWEKVLLGSF
jgi:hypothetical protein